MHTWVFTHCRRGLAHFFVISFSNGCLLGQTSRFGPFASEALIVLPLLLPFVRHVLVPTALRPRHCECFTLPCKIVGVLQTGDRACQRGSELAGLVERRAVLYADIYPEAVRPKFHYMLLVAP